MSDLDLLLEASETAEKLRRLTLQIVHRCEAGTPQAQATKAEFLQKYEHCVIDEATQSRLAQRILAAERTDGHP